MSFSVSNIISNNPSLSMFFGSGIPCNDFVSEYSSSSISVITHINSELGKLCSSEKRSHQEFEASLLKIAGGSIDFLTSFLRPSRPFVHEVMNIVNLNNGFAEALINLGKKKVYQT